MFSKRKLYPIALMLCLATACSDNESTSNGGDAARLADVLGKEAVEKPDVIGQAELDTSRTTDTDTQKVVDVIADVEAGQLPDAAGDQETTTTADAAIDAYPDSQPPEITPLPTELTAKFTASPKTGNPPLEVSFDAGASYDPDGGALDYNWDFGDNTFGSGVQVVHTYQDLGTYSVKLTIDSSSGGTASTAELIFVVEAEELPPSPEDVAPPLDTTVSTNASRGSEFVYAGDEPIQIGVAKDTIVPERAAAVRAQVTATDGSAVEGVRVEVAGHPEYGHTLTREDGVSDLVVNGGDPVVLSYRKAGYLPVHREIAAKALDYNRAPDVVLTPLDSKVTVVDGDDPLTVARGSIKTDEDGTRQATLLVPQGIQAEAVLSDGTKEELTGLSIRATEYTVGDTGPNAMPSVLPVQSGYTYCVELSVDEAMAQDAVDVEFDQTVYYYQENFLGFPSGSIVPSGYYDREAKEWVASENGVVVDVVGESGGLAELDVDGDGIADGAAKFEELGVTEDELASLAELYEPGQSLWRVPVSHFTPWDLNWPYGPPDDAKKPKPPKKPDDEKEKPCDPPRPVVEFQTRVVGENVPVQGTPYSLVYRSNRVAGAAGKFRIEVPISGDSIPASVERIVASVQVAGRYYFEEFAPATNLSHVFEWDGIDVYGRVVQGSQPATITVEYWYEAGYTEPADVVASFGQEGVASMEMDQSRAEVALTKKWTEMVGLFDVRSLGLGGWTIDVHHSYDPVNRVFNGGDGSRRELPIQSVGAQLDTVAGYSIYEGSPPAIPKEGVLAKDAYLFTATNIAVGPDGSIYITSPTLSMVRRIGPDGLVTTFAGKGTIGSGGDGGPALNAGLKYPRGMAVDKAGNVYIADMGNNRVRRVDTDGNIDTVAGTGLDCNSGWSCYAEGEGGKATDAYLWQPQDVALGPDGELYIATQSRVVKVDKEGLLTTVIGCDIKTLQDTQTKLVGCECGKYPVKGCCEGKIAYSCDTGWGDYVLWDIDCTDNPSCGWDPIWEIYSCMTDGAEEPSGTYPKDCDEIPDKDCTNPCDAADEEKLADLVELCPTQGLAVASDGTVYVGDCSNYIYSIDPDGNLKHISGTGNDWYWGEDWPAVDADVVPLDLEIGPDGALYVAHHDSEEHIRIRRIGSDGIITHWAGDPSSSALWNAEKCAAWDACTNQSAPIKELCLCSADSLAFGPDETLYIMDYFYIRAVGSAGFKFGEVLIPSESGSEVYLFDAEGRHLKTFHALTGALIYEFGYNEDGYLTKITDRDGRETEVTRDSKNEATAIIAPFGQQTAITVDNQGHLGALSSVSGETYQMTYGQKGLMASFSVPTGDKYAYTFDAEGQLQTYIDPGNTTAASLKQTLKKPTAVEVTHTTPTGLETVYRFENLPDDGYLRERTDPSGAVTSMAITAKGKRDVMSPDGTVTTLELQPDPRFGLALALPATVMETTPSGLTSVTTFSRKITLTDKFKPLSLSTQEDTIDVNGRVYTVDFDASTGKVTNTSPQGRVSSFLVDEAARILQWNPDLAMTPITFVHDEDGFMTEVAQGALGWVFEYDTAGRLVSRANAAGDKVLTAYDAGDRLTEVVSPAGRLYEFGYDKNGSRNKVIMPSGAALTLLYSQVDLDSGFTPPGGQGFVTEYNQDREPVTYLLPSGATITNTLKDGRLSVVDYADATIAYGYSPNSGCCGSSEHLASVTRTPTAGTPQTLSFVHDGKLVEQIAFSGVAAGTYDFAYDKDFNTTSVSFNGGPAAAVVRDNDGLIIGHGGITFTRAGPGGTVSAVQHGTMNVDVARDGWNRLAGRTLKVGGATAFSMQLSHDLPGRISQKVQTVDGVAHTYDYSYDLDGWLLEVKRDSQVVESYGYDDNGNRTTPLATYDLQDRMTKFGAVTYEFNEDGFLAKRGTDTFDYSAKGELLSASVGGQQTTYVYDGLNRRVGAVTPAGTYHYLYGNPENIFELTSSRDPAGLWTHYYYDDEAHLFALESGGKWYYAGTDQVGTVHALFDQSGTAVKVIEYDTFGKVLSDSAPAFDLVVGYAGGIRDSVTGLVRFGFRDYDPVVGRWTARDPALFAGGQANLYAYAGSNPVSLRDPSGLWCAGGGVGGLFKAFYAGGKVCCQGGKCQVCVDAGLGTPGVHASFDPFGGMERPGWSLQAGFGIGVGPLGGGLSGKINDCGAKVTPSTPTIGHSKGGQNPQRANMRNPFSVGAKLTGQYCF